MCKDMLACFFVYFVHWEVNDKAHLEGIFFDQVETLCYFVTDLTSQLCSSCLFVSDEVENAAWLQCSLLSENSLLILWDTGNGFPAR